MIECFWLFTFCVFILHVQAITASIYIHRYIIHETIVISKNLEEIFKFVQWITGNYFKNYKIILCTLHRKHHATSDSLLDPHSPYYLTILQHYKFDHKLSAEDYEKYAQNVIPNESNFEKKIYIPYAKLGFLFWVPFLFLLFSPLVALFGVVLVYFSLTKVYPFFGNILFHKFGYYVKNGNRKEDKSRNFVPWGIIFCGEELHSNHHNNPGDPKYSRRWYEFDIGWLYIKVLMMLKLVNIKSKRA